MEPWLVIAVPLVLVPVILLLGYSGCALIAGLDDHYAAVETYRDVILKEPALVGYWRLDDAKGSVKAKDSSGKLGADGEYVNVGSVTFEAPGALKGGVNHSVVLSHAAGTYIQVPFALNLNAAGFTVEAWVKLDPVHDRAPDPTDPKHLLNYEGVVASFSGVATDTGYELLVHREAGTAGPAVRKLVAVLHPGGIQDIPEVAMPIDAGWHHVVMTCDTSHMVRLYLDGQPVGSAGPHAYAQNMTASLVIGARVPGGALQNSLDGGIDEVAVYNAPLSAQAVQAHYAAAGQS